MTKFFFLSLLLSQSVWAQELDCSKFQDWRTSSLCKNLSTDNYYSLENGSYGVRKNNPELDQLLKVYSERRRKISDASEETKGNLTRSYQRMQNLIKSAGNWQLCPENFIPYCTIIVLSKSPYDNRGELLNGVPAPELFVQTDESRLVLMKKFLDNFEHQSLNKKSDQDSIKEIRTVAENYREQVKTNQIALDEFNHDVKQELIPAIREALIKSMNKN